MKALVMPSYGVLEIRELETPVIGDDDVLVRIRATGICGSDIHGLDGSTGRRIPPLVMGHEASGTIESVGAVVEGFRIGDRVTFDSTIWCGVCGHCSNGQVNFCENRQVFGVACDEYSRQGTFAEYVCVPARVLYRIPPGMTFQEASMVEPLSIAVHAVGITPVEAGDVALVIGAGVIGLMTLQVLLNSGCSRVIVADIDEDRLAMAESLGASRTINTKTKNMDSMIEKVTGSSGADISFDAVGLSETVNSSIRNLRKGGTATIIGNLNPEAVVPLQKIVSRQLRIQGSNASCGEYPECIDMINTGRVDVRSLISRIVPLTEAADWFTRLHKGDKGLLKVIMEP